MESSAYELNALSSWEYLSLFLFRPLLAIIFVLSLLLLGWFLAWKLVLVHVPLVQEIFGLRKKPVNRKPENRRRLTQFYNNLNSQSSVSQWCCDIVSGTSKD
ncbi:uncharacterized protein LOC107766186 [Nicotiana tabacum]|uniref:Uncharacterized protein LOC107766186 n=2 Tax=Nicotiana tabacum TaxID=4097 RepID=A0A1S3XKH6_TOBAC|nr:PREDICTED: uncharacterized protein LOC107766186 isoform X2 [Nicotiana tabacum]